MSKSKDKLQAIDKVVSQSKMDDTHKIIRYTDTDYPDKELYFVTQDMSSLPGVIKARLKRNKDKQELHKAKRQKRHEDKMVRKYKDKSI